ncbi:SGNH/GDSL hydrolase family protein [uncultured Sulfitobacter sp.]|uniref:SGNH/GDSL hydrolase family protein n=1 Tax=uncultured Sulfitobacter sp. TaxID=191468 RepID=UPI0030D8762E|tara:strand:- start:60455 stop:61168 length:714 start_codon:yes stop_codon:yes gene_type:complete
MKNVVIIGDSLACPRPWIGLGQRGTYASLLQQAAGDRVHVISLAGGERSTRYYATGSFEKNYIEDSDTDTLIVQLGIVDCAPRLMTFFERGIGFMCRKSRPANALFLKYVATKSRYRLFFTKHFPNIMVKLPEFERNILNILCKYVTKGGAKTVIFINIAYPGPHLTERSFEVLKIISNYNDVLDRTAQTDPDRIKVIDLFSITRDAPHLITPEDGHHITKAAHKILADRILSMDRF